MLNLYSLSDTNITLPHQLEKENKQFGMYSTIAVRTIRYRYWEVKAFFRRRRRCSLFVVTRSYKLNKKTVVSPLVLRVTVYSCPKEFIEKG